MKLQLYKIGSMLFSFYILVGFVQFIYLFIYFPGIGIYQLSFLAVMILSCLLLQLRHILFLTSQHQHFIHSPSELTKGVSRGHILMRLLLFETYYWPISFIAQLLIFHPSAKKFVLFDILPGKGDKPADMLAISSLRYWFQQIGLRRQSSPYCIYILSDILQIAFQLVFECWREGQALVFFAVCQDTLIINEHLFCSDLQNQVFKFCYPIVLQHPGCSRQLIIGIFPQLFELLADVLHVVNRWDSAKLKMIFGDSQSQSEATSYEGNEYQGVEGKIHVDLKSKSVYKIKRLIFGIQIIEGKI